MKKAGRPEKGELVIAKITKIYPNSAQAELIEYNLTGMIHVSEVVRRWVRSIKEFIREGQMVVAKVIGTDDPISLSIKRVERHDKEKKLKEFKAEKKAEKLLVIVAKTLGIDFNKAWQEIGLKMQDEFGSMAAGFEMAFKSPDFFTKKIGQKWAQTVIEVAKKSYTQKQYEIKVQLKLICLAPDGIDIIKRTLQKIDDFEIKYLSAPNYMLIGRGSNYKELRAKIEAAAKAVVEAIKPGEASWEVIE